MNPEAEEFAAAYWEKEGKECNDCPFKQSWKEDGMRYVRCIIVEEGDAEFCPAWGSREDEEDEDE